MNYQFFNEKTVEGKNGYIQYIKLLIYKTRNDLFNLLAFDEEAPFMEPLLYTWFNAREKKISLDQILYGYIAPDKRPACITVYPDTSGIIYLPVIGYYHTNVLDGPMEYYGNPDPQKAKLVVNGEAIQATWEPVYLLNNSSIELYLHNNPLLYTLFEGSEDLSIEETVDRHTLHLEKALAYIKAYYPEFDELLHATVKRVVIYKSKQVRSFATMLANGTAFFNAHDWHDEVFFCEDITHQCGHVIYYAVMFNKASFFSVPPETPLKEFNKRPNDGRTVLGAFYSLLPFCFSNTNSYRLFEAGLFSDRQLHEFLGRFAFRMRKFKVALEDFRSGEMLSEKGKTLWKEFEQTLNEVEENVQSFLYQYDTSNQDYDFSYENFLQLNPILHPVTSQL
jgi:hypothetical protein